MTEHIEYTIQELNQRIEKLTSARDLLRGMIGEPLNPRTVAPVAVVPVAAPIRAKARTNPVPAGKPVAPKQRRSEAGERAILAAKTLAEPFSPGDLAQRIGGNPKNAGNSLNRWKAKGWLASEGFGKYRRTASFGGASTTQATLDAIHAKIKPAPTEA